MIERYRDLDEVFDLSRLLGIDKLESPPLP
jgi:hypothetical protein